MSETVTVTKAPEVPVAGPQASSTASLAKVIRPALGFLANVTVLTALLVYFGWRRSATQAERLGIDQSLLGMSTRDYVLRSVGPVFWLLLVIGAAGLTAVMVEPAVTRFMRQRLGRDDTPLGVTVLLRAMGLAWIVLPLVVVLLWNLRERLAFILFPASIGAGIVLALYARHLRNMARPPEIGDDRRHLLSGGFAGLLVALSAFWMASNYAEVLGVRLADNFARDLEHRPGVILYSERWLRLEGPGVVERRLTDSEGGGPGVLRYRYDGLRLLERTGGKLFLVSDEWTSTRGVVFVLPDDDPTTRFDFVRGRP